MSAGELEHEWAGTPGRLIRERYRKAAEVARVCTSLVILAGPLSHHFHSAGWQPA